MNENDNHINDMQQLAETGWKQMHETLRDRGLSADASILAPASKKRNIFPVAAACVLFVLMFSFPYLLNNKFHFSLNQQLNIATPSFIQKPTTVTQSVKMISPVKESGMLSKEKNIIYGQLNSVFIDTKKEQFTISIQPQNDAYIKKASCGEISTKSILKTELLKDAVDTINAVPSDQKKSKASVSKKIQLFAGAGVNISTGNQDRHLFSFNDLNVHPGIAVIIPLSGKLSLHSGLWAFSTIRGTEASSKERELVNNISSNVYYNVNTTSIVKASYFDVPLTLHYAINKSWSVGSGLQLSKLYKVNIREQKESFDYNNTRFSATVQQYNSTPSQAAIVLQKKAEIKNYETRFVAETNFRQGKWLFSAGYYYGLGKTITLKEPDNTSHQYRNEYFKLGIQYRIR